MGFTDLASTLPPAEICSFLDTLYTAFDGLLDSTDWDVCKVETIGEHSPE